MVSAKSKDYSLIYRRWTWITGMAIALFIIVDFALYVLTTAFDSVSSPVNFYAIYNPINYIGSYVVLALLVIFALFLALLTSQRIRQHHQINAIILTTALLFGYAIVTFGVIVLIVIGGNELVILLPLHS